MQDDIPRLPPKERLILELLINRGEAYGLELVKIAPAQLKRGTVYATLGRMAGKGYVDSRQVKESGTPGLPRHLFSPTDYGRRVFKIWTKVLDNLTSIPQTSLRQEACPYCGARSKWPN